MANSSQLPSDSTIGEDNSEEDSTTPIGSRSSSPCKEGRQSLKVPVLPTRKKTKRHIRRGSKREELSIKLKNSSVSS
jgi:hypothetical protein